MKSGFYLVEIMIIVAIVCILAAIAVPSMLHANGERKKISDYQFNGHSFIHDPNCGCHKYGKLRN